MKPLAAFFAVCLLAGCGQGQPPPVPPTEAKAAPVQSVTTTTPQQFLLASAAKDFHAHQPPYPARFRDVRFGHIAAPDGTRQYLLCGEFLPAQAKGAPEWTHFVTIQTSGYEQMLGATTKGYCERPSTIWEDGDSSSALKGQLDALR